MGHFATISRARTLAAIGVSSATFSTLALCVALATATGADAANKKQAAPAAPASEADQKKETAAAARHSYDAGVQSYYTGKHQIAVDQLSGALRGGGLSSAEMAKALYLRGVSYKKLNKPGLAISDLTSALWLKNGLGEADQKAAIAERADAYRMAGLSDGDTGADAQSVAAPNPKPAGAKAAGPAAGVSVPVPVPAPIPTTAAAVTLAAAPAQSAEPQIAVSTGQVTRQSPDSESARDAANARRIAAQPVETNGLQSVASASVIGEQPRASLSESAPAMAASTAAAPAVSAPVSAQTPPSAPVLSAAPIEDQPQSSAPVTSASGGLSSVGGFFSNLFSGGNAPAPSQGSAASVTTASTSPPPPATSSWSDTTSVASGNTKPETVKKPVQVAAAAPPVPVTPAAPAVKSGKYKLHIAAVRSRAEADALAQKLATQQGAALKSRMPVVDEAVIGSMGTFYRVRVGSYANPDEPRGVCNTLRSSGFDCLVVTN